MLLPETSTPRNGDPAVAPGAALARPTSRNGHGAAPHRVLVVDDEADVLASLRAILEQAGYQVVATTSVPEALAAIRDQSFELIVSDLYLADGEMGSRLADAAHGVQPRVPVVLLTGRPTFDGAAEALKCRVSEIVVKPVDPHALVHTCRRTIQDHELARRNEQLEIQNEILAAVLPRAIEAKDPTTSGHAERVVRYVDTLAQRCGVGAEDRESLRLAALLHDVGKIGIPDRILTKPGPVTADEREVINRHRPWATILRRCARAVRRWVYQHHSAGTAALPWGLAARTSNRRAASRCWLRSTTLVERRS
jgi:putative two-component system response regulator